MLSRLYELLDQRGRGSIKIILWSGRKQHWLNCILDARSRMSKILLQRRSEDRARFLCLVLVHFNWCIKNINTSRLYKSQQFYHKLLQNVATAQFPLSLCNLLILYTISSHFGEMTLIAARSRKHSTWMLIDLCKRLAETNKMIIVISLRVCLFFFWQNLSPSLYLHCVCTTFSAVAQTDSWDVAAPEPETLRWFNGWERISVIHLHFALKLASECW